MKHSLELVAKRRGRKAKIENIVLSSLAIAGVLTLAVAAPNTLQLLKYVDPDVVLGRNPRRRLQQTASRLKRKGLISYEHRDNKTFLKLSPKGEKVASQVRANTYAIKKPLRWDKKWRVVIFDISEKRRIVRDRIRRLIEGLGFYRLQNSVWVYPYDCEEVITILKTELHIGSDLLYIIAEAIEYDRPLCDYFGLKAK